MKAAPGKNPETALDQGKDNAQVRLFNPSRYAPVQVAILQRLPESSARAFYIAAALGSLRDANGSNGPLSTGKNAAGSLVTYKRLPAVLQAIGVEARQWRRYVQDWEGRYVAHRCGRGVVFLFTMPLFEDCPACGCRIDVDHVPPSFRTNRGRGFGNGRDVTAEAVVVRPESGSGTTAAAVQERPLIERKNTPPLGRFHLGVVVGAEEVSFEALRGEDREAFLRAQEEINEAGLGKIAPPRSKTSLADRIVTGASPADDEVADAS